MPEVIQDRPKVSDFHKTIHVALESNFICKLKEYRKCHHQMRYISRGCSVTLAVLYGANPLSALLEKSTYGYRFKSGTTINHLLFMDDLKLYAKNEQDIDSLIHLTRVFSSYIGMTFGLAKVKSTSGVSLPESQIDDIDESYKYLGILQSFDNNDEEPPPSTET